MNKAKIVFLLLLPVILTCAVVTLKHPVLNIETPSDWDDETIIILRDSVELELKGGNKRNNLVLTHIKWYKINKTTPAKLKKFKIYYTEYLENKPQIRIKAIYKNGICKNIVNVKHKKDVYYSYNLYKHKTSYQTLEAQIPNYSNLEYLRFEKKRSIKNVEEFGCFTFRNFAYNVLQKNIILSWPKEYELNYGLENKEGLEVKTSTKTVNGKNIFSLESTNLKALRKYQNHKYPELWYASFFVSFPPKGNESYTWEELGQYYFNRIYDSLSNKDTSIIDSIANTITGSYGEEIIQKAFDFVKDNIRYYGSWEKSYGWIPRGPEEIFEKGYGDCKEMANLLAMILRKKGINTSLSLLKRHGGFKFIEKYPTLDLTNHIITCVERKNGQRLYLDATTKNSNYKTSYFEYLNQILLVMKKDGSFIDTVHPGPEYQNKIITNSEIKRDNPTNGKWLIAGDIKLYGEVASDLFMELKDPDNTNKEKVLNNFLEYILQIKPDKTELKKVSHLEISIDYTADFSQCFLTSPVKGLLFTRPSLYTPYYYYSDLSYEGNRYLSKVEQIDTWKIPKTFKKYNFTNLNNSYAKGTWNSTKNSVTRTYSCEFTHIDASERDKLKKFFNERNNFTRGIAWSK